MDLFELELLCADFVLLVELVEAEFVFVVTVLLVMAVGGRSLRLALLAVVLFAAIALADGGRFGLAAALAATTPFPLKTPGFALAATVGCPWFTEANCARLVLAVCSCCICSEVG